MHSFKFSIIAGAVLALSAIPAVAAPDVVVSIKPIHSLVSAVMGEVGKPELLLKGASSPHDYALKPSQAAQLQEADLIFWVGDDLEAFLKKPLETIGANARSVEMIKTSGLVRHEFRDSHEEHAHEEHAEDDHGHDDHAHEEHAEGEHGHVDHAHEETRAGHDGLGHDGHGHAHDGDDPHIWLDPENAHVMAEAIAEALAEADPGNAEVYQANAAALASRLDELTGEVGAKLALVKGRQYAAFHDAYQYFEKRFGLGTAIAVTLSPEVAPGAARIGEVREAIGKLGKVCVFSEPQFEPKLIATVTEGTSARTGQIDPLGANLEAGPNLYFSLIQSVADTFSDCLAETG